MPRAASNPAGPSAPTCAASWASSRGAQLLRGLPEHELEVADLPDVAGEHLRKLLSVRLGLREGLVRLGRRGSARLLVR